MRKLLWLFCALLLFAAAADAATITTKNYFAPPKGGSKDNGLYIGGNQYVVSGGSLTVQSGGTLLVQSGATLNIKDGATVISSSTYENVTGALGVTITYGVRAGSGTIDNQLYFGSGRTRYVANDGTNYELDVSTRLSCEQGVTFGATGRQIIGDPVNYRINIDSDTKLGGDVTLESGDKLINTTAGTVVLGNSAGTAAVTVRTGGQNVSLTASNSIEATYGVIMSTLEATSGILNVCDRFVDVPAASTSAWKSDYLCYVSTVQLIAGATTWTRAAGDIPNTYQGRNVVVQQSYVVGVASQVCEGTWGISGILVRTGAMGYEALTGTSTQVAGNEAWVVVDTITYTATKILDANTNVYFGIGTGVKLGLHNDIAASGDVLYLNEAGTYKATPAAVDTTYNTVTMNTAPNGTNDYDVWSKPRRR